MRRRRPQRPGRRGSFGRGGLPPLALMADLAIAAAAWHVPERTVAVADLPELAALTEVERATCLGLGIERVPADDRLDAVELAVLASERALGRAGLEAGRLGAALLVEDRESG